MTTKIVMLGYGPVAQAATQSLIRQGRSVVVAQRSKPATLPEGASFQACDVLDAGAVRQIAAEASEVVMTVGFPYLGRVWKDVWPRAMSNLIEACAASRARLVFADNLYMYGPQTSPLREDMPVTSYGVKPAVRAEVTRIWKQASEAGRARVAALRAPDFYGPDVALSHLGDVAFGALARGKTATLLIPPDTPHAFAYVPDIGRGIATLVSAPDDAFGQAWHIPCAPLRTPREILALGATALGRPLRIRSLPLWMLPVAGIVSPFFREVAEMRFTFDRHYDVDSRKFAGRFWKDATPFEAGAATTAQSLASRSRSRAPLPDC
jgi:nucleoside-diphosphate-sugar epimerase